MGDFNVNLINCNEDGNASNFLHAILSHFIHPFITTPTRIPRNTKTQTDNIFYKKPLNDIMFGNLSSISSDYHLQFLIKPLNFTKISTQMIYRQRYYKNVDKLQFRADLIKVNWDSFSHDSNPNAALGNFLKIVEKQLGKDAMVAETLQKYVFIFNTFLSKKLYIFIFNQKNIFLL